jgi:hypothetical protein
MITLNAASAIAVRICCFLFEAGSQDIMAGSFAIRESND